MTQDKKHQENTCGDCEHLDSIKARCRKYRCPVPVNIYYQFLKTLMCKEEKKNENKNQT